MEKPRGKQRKEGEHAGWPLQQSCGHKHFPKLLGPVGNEADSVTGSEETNYGRSCLLGTSGAKRGTSLLR